MMKEVETILTCEITIFMEADNDSELDEIVPEKERNAFGEAVRERLDEFIGNYAANRHISPPKVQVFVREVSE